jgi:hypothetical protein
MSATLLTAAVITLAACSPTASPEPSKSPTPKASATGGVVTNIQTQPGSGDKFVGALADVKITTCDADKAPAKFAGTVTNPEKSAQSYRIYVSLLTSSATIGVDEVDVDKVGAGKTVKWSGTLNAGEQGTRCVLRVERTAA